MDSVKDLINDFKRVKKLVEIVPENQATLKLYVVGRNLYEAGLVSQMSHYRWRTTVDTAPNYGKVVYALMVAPNGYQMQVMGYDGYGFTSWSMAAHNLAHYVRNWIKMNTAQLRIGD